MHSPFVYHFYSELIKNKNPFDDFTHLNEIRLELLKNKTVISFVDLGAGSRKINSTKNNTNQRTIRQIAKHGISQKKQAEFLYRVVNYFSPNVIVEIGTSIGLSTLYLSKAKSSATVYTLEGSEELVKFSKALFEKEGCRNIESVSGNFNESFPMLLQKLPQVDFLFLDGNHQYDTTVNYFNLAIKKKNSQSVFIIDDINWSSEMQRAWKYISEHPEVRLSFDFFQFGVVFFREEQKEKEHFVLKF